MEIKDLLQANIFLPWVFIIGFLGSIGIEIAPIKLNPWSSIFKWIGKQINSEVHKELKVTEKNINNKIVDVNDRIDSITKIKSKHYQEIIDKIESNQESISELSKEIDIQGMENYRWAILRFANDIRINTPKSKDEFMHIFEISNKYHHLIDKHGLKNGLIDTEMGLIRKRYEEHCINNDFLA